MVIRGRSRSDSHLVWLVQQANSVACPQRVYIIALGALREFVRLRVLETHYALSHYAAVPVLTAALVSCEARVQLMNRCPVLLSSRRSLLTSVVMAHSYVVSDHVRHRSGEYVRLITVGIDRNTDRLGRAYCFGNGHSRFPSGKGLSSGKDPHDQRANS